MHQWRKEKAELSDLEFRAKMLILETKRGDETVKLEKEKARRTAIKNKVLITASTLLMW